MKKPFKKKYRVLEVKRGDNTSLFYPQWRRIFMWKSMPQEHSTKKAEWFSSLSEANEYLAKITKDDRRKTVVGKEAHEFDELFHKLSTHGQEENQFDTDGQVDPWR